LGGDGSVGTGRLRMGWVGTGRAKIGWLGTGRSGSGRSGTCWLQKNMQRTFLLLTGLAPIGHRDARFGDFRCNYESPVASE
jgi:hypothetical protein